MDKAVPLADAFRSGLFFDRRDCRIGIKIERISVTSSEHRSLRGIAVFTRLVTVTLDLDEEFLAPKSAERVEIDSCRGVVLASVLRSYANRVAKEYVTPR